MFAKGGWPKPAADSIHALLRLLSDARWNAKTRRWETKSFIPGSLEFSLSKVPSTVHSVLLQKSNGRFFVIIWNEVKNWEPKTGTPVDVNPVNAQLRIEADVTQIRTFVPNDSGTEPTGTTNQANAIRLAILDRPTIVEIQTR
jgi:hypothetical protein